MIFLSSDICLHSMALTSVERLRQCACPPNELSGGGHTCSVTLLAASSLCNDSFFAA